MARSCTVLTAAPDRFYQTQEPIFGIERCGRKIECIIDNLDLGTMLEDIGGEINDN